MPIALQKILARTALCIALFLVCLPLSLTPAQAQSAEYQAFTEALEGSDASDMIARFQALPTEEREAALMALQVSVGGAISDPDRLDAIAEAMNTIMTSALLFSAPVPSEADESSQGSVRGIVRRAGSGRPMAGIRVTIGMQLDVSGPDGTFHVRDVPIGDWTASVRHNGDPTIIRPEDQFEETSFDVTVAADEVTEISVEVGEPEILLSGRLRGTVVDADTGDPIEAAIFRVSPQGTSLRQVLAATSVQTDTEGHFEALGLPVGEVSIVLAGTTEAALRTNGVIYRPFQITTTIADDQTTEIEFALQPFRAPQRTAKAAINGTVRDIVTGEPIQGASIGVRAHLGTSEADGRYRVAQITAGETQIARVSHPGYVSQDIPLGLLNAGLTKRDIALFPAGLAAVRVLVTDASTGVALPNAAVVVGGQQDRTSENGDLTLMGVVAGEVRAQASRDGYQSTSSSTVVPEGATGEIQIALEPVTQGQISVLVLDAETGARLPGVTVQIGAFTGQAGADGRVISPDLLAGPVFASATAPGYRDNTAAATITAGEVTELSLTLDPITTGTVRVVLTDAETGAPLANAFVQAAGISTETDAQGIAVFADRPAGDITVQATNPEYLAGSIAATLPRADTVEVALALEPITTGTVNIRVVDTRDGSPLSDATLALGAHSGTAIGAGQFTFENVPEGALEAVASAPLYKTGIVDLRVHRTEVTNSVIRLEPILTGGVTVQVVNAADNAPLVGALVTIAGLQAVTGADGRARMSGVSAGAISVQAAATLFESGDASTTLARGGTVDLLIALEPITYGTVTVQVVDRRNGQALPGARVQVSGRQMIAANDETFTFDRVPAGDLTLFGSAPDYADGTISLSLAPGQTKVVRLELDPILPGTITGTIADAQTGSGIGGVEVRIGGMVVETDASGRFSATGVPPGTTQVTLRHPQYADLSTLLELASDGEAALEVALQTRTETVQDIASAITTDGAIDLYGIFFDFGEEQFTQASLPTLEQVRAFVTDAGSTRFVVEGHTDSKGSDAFNQDLSERRAASVVRWLVANGVRDDQLRAAGLGENLPAASNETDAGRALNRRVVLRAID